MVDQSYVEGWKIGPSHDINRHLANIGSLIRLD
jgi:hypothetical protein